MESRENKPLLKTQQNSSLPIGGDQQQHLSPSNAILPLKQMFQCPNMGAIITSFTSSQICFSHSINFFIETLSTMGSVIQRRRWIQTYDPHTIGVNWQRSSTGTIFTKAGFLLSQNDVKDCPQADSRPGGWCTWHWSFSIDAKAAQSLLIAFAAQQRTRHLHQGLDLPAQYKATAQVGATLEVGVLIRVAAFDIVSTLEVGVLCRVILHEFGTLLQLELLNLDLCNVEDTMPVKIAFLLVLASLNLHSWKPLP
ncbi:hypothetical protein BDR26DRAFT_922528 [Obelidium mucronatum]|nr:hypothetical protein BDR26DRAFT_922528 [Obelidium mucronatum]